jgi:hypothetical protein
MVPLTTINTKNILFICGGAFPDLDEVIKQRLNKQTSIGYNAELKDKYDKEKNIHKHVTVEDLKKFGKGTGINTYPNQGGISNPYYYQPIPGTLGTITCNSAKINTSSDEDTIASLNDLGGTNE